MSDDRNLETENGSIAEQSVGFCDEFGRLDSRNEVDSGSLNPDVSEGILAWQIELTGRVQGVGVRPAIMRLAQACQLNGHVRNSGEGVEIVVEGCRDRLDRFWSQLKEWLPKEANFSVQGPALLPIIGLNSFCVLKEETSGPIGVTVPVDLAICSECQSEVLSDTNRRFDYEWNSCTACGPRYSILESLPYERSATSMRDFTMCEECRIEYDSLADRRCHTESLGCVKCGPRAYFLSPGKEREFAEVDAAFGPVSGTESRSTQVVGRSAIELAAEKICAGGVLLVKGIGGYQLVCDATNEEAVSRLRRIKGRPRKPFAVMISEESALKLGIARDGIDNGSEVRRCVGNESNDSVFAILSSRANPIVLSEELDSSRLAPSVAPGVKTVGYFLPTSALHSLLLSCCGRELIVTSGNFDGTPIIFEENEEWRTLLKETDGCLAHARRIVRPIDDSVVRMIGKRGVPLRVGRGLAPMVVSRQAKLPSILAVGAEQKVALCFGNGKQVILGAHIGDLRSIECRDRFRTEVKGQLDLYRCVPQMFACDLHPDYFTTRWSEEQGVELLRVQHHHAHVAASIVEHSLADEPVLGVAFDGTGYGPDGTVWGGEFLVASLERYQRVGHLRPFALPGGERCSREVWRIAASLLREAFPEWDSATVAEYLTRRSSAYAEWSRGNECGSREPDRKFAQDCEQLLDQRVIEMSVRTSSVGRLFDGVASILLGKFSANYEGELAMELESLVEGGEQGCYEILNERGAQGEWLGDWREMFRAIVRELEKGCEPSLIAAKFHRALARWVVQMARLVGCGQVVATGGCFQNRILTEWTEAAFEGESARVYGPNRLPPNDGSLSVGQLAVAAAVKFGERIRLLP